MDTCTNKSYKYNQTNTQNDTTNIPIQYPHKTLEERAAKFNGNLFLDGEYEAAIPIGKEIW